MSAYADFLRTTKKKGEAKKLEAYIRERRDKNQLQNPSAGNVVDVSSLLREEEDHLILLKVGPLVVWIRHNGLVAPPLTLVGEWFT
jgi:hypothetical protein